MGKITSKAIIAITDECLRITFVLNKTQLMF